MYSLTKDNIKICVVGLGYVGLPLSVILSEKYSVIGFDTDKDRIKSLKNGIDETLEVSKQELKSAEKLKFTSELQVLAKSNVFIITVPTPIDKFKRPDLRPLLQASKIIGTVLKRNDVVIYESTVYPGCTEEECVPVLEKNSNLIFNQDFYCGYSPERIVPGDKTRNIRNIKKVTSGSTPEVSKFVDNLYNSVIDAGTFKADSIKVAEAAKVIENTQRDVNIALINELAIIFNKLKIDTQSVLDAAETKWNYLPFRPGLVGGHCIGVDPHYIKHKSEGVGYYPKIISAARRINDNMGIYVATNLIKVMLKKKIQTHNSKILILGFTFKENCPDTRNSRVEDILSELLDYNCDVDIYDPWVQARSIEKNLEINLIEYPQKNTYDAIIIAVAHDEFKKIPINTLKGFCKKISVIYDLKHILPKKYSDIRL